MNVLKRRRTELACVGCRRKKAKCDGIRPSCSTCSSEKLSCQYEVNSNVQVNRQGGISRSMLEDKVVQLERELAASRRRETSLQSSTILTGEANNVPTSDSVHDPSLIQSSENVDLPVEVSDEEAAIDTLATTAFSHEPEISIGHFGPSSNHGYFRALSTVFAHLPEDGRAAEPKSLHRWSRRRQAAGHNSAPETTRRELCNPSVLPDISTAMFLFNQFFASMSLALTYINRSNVLRNYNDLHEGPTRPLHSVRRALFNILWAHGAAAASRDDAETFYRRAMRCLNTLNIREAGNELVQLLLLICHFQQNHQRSVASWTFHALAVKTAFQMGLHAPSTYDGLSSDENQLRLQLWLGVLNQDRFLATTLGRPCLIPRQHARAQERFLNQPIAIGSDPVSFSSSKGMDFSRHLTSFYDIVATIVETLYDHNITAELLSREELCSQRLKLHLQLEQWKVSLPHAWSPCLATDLQHRSENERDSMWPRALLAIHYHRAQFLVNRPVITSALRAWVFGHNATFHATDQVSTAVLQADFASAKELIGVVRGLIQTGSTILQRHAMWFSANYSVFAACVHLFGILLAFAKWHSIPSSLGIGLNEVRLEMQQGLDLLKIVGANSLMSQKGAACLLTFLDVFDSFIATESSPRASDIDGFVNAPNSLLFDQTMQAQPGLISDFIMQATEDFFLGGLEGQYFGSDPYNILQ